MSKYLEKNVIFTSAGYCAEVYSDDDGGFGENARVGRWYGTREACEALDPREVDLYPIRPESEVDEVELACERKFD